MDIFHANPLKEKGDIFQRGLFRFIWCSLGGIGTYLFIVSGLKIPMKWWILPLLLSAVVVMGILSDRYRLKKQKNGSNL